MKILIIRFSSIGDIVLTTPVMRCVKTQRPDIEIHFLTKKPFAPMLQANPHIDVVHTLGATVSDTLAVLRKERFDQVIDLHHNLRTWIFKFRLGLPAYSFNKLNLQKWLLVRFKIDRLPAVHIVDRYLDTVKHLGVQNDGRGLEYHFSGEYELANLLPVDFPADYVAVVIGGQHATKRLPVPKLIGLCRSIAAPIVLLGGKEDAENGATIAAAVPGVRNCSGSYTLDESVFVLKHARHVFTHDTGLMHIAAAFDKTITSIWGNTVPKLGMTPYLVSRSFIAEHPTLGCRPCSKIGYAKCPLGHFKCMNELDMAEIAATARQGS